jgi:hypothetical protein
VANGYNKSGKKCPLDLIPKGWQPLAGGK